MHHRPRPTQDHPTSRAEPAGAHHRRRGGRGRGERGEGVISTAIAVLIVAFLGVAMWAGFNTMFQDAQDTTRDQIEQIGR